MATIKSFTSLEQSRKLAEILPLESADMSWVSCDDGRQKYYQAENRKIILMYEKKHWIPCWSLAALLSVIPNYKLSSEHNYHSCAAETPFGKETVAWFDNPVDACVEMIIKLKENNLL